MRWGLLGGFGGGAEWLRAVLPDGVGAAAVRGLAVLGELAVLVVLAGLVMLAVLVAGAGLGLGICCDWAAGCLAGPPWVGLGRWRRSSSGSGVALAEQGYAYWGQPYGA